MDQHSADDVASSQNTCSHVTGKISYVTHSVNIRNVHILNVFSREEWCAMIL